MSLGKRIGQAIPKRVRIAPDQKHAGRTGTVELVYYERLHTGDSYDQLQVGLDGGGWVRGPADCFESIDDEPVAPLVQSADRRFVNTTFGDHPRLSSR